MQTPPTEPAGCPSGGLVCLDDGLVQPGMVEPGDAVRSCCEHRTDEIAPRDDQERAAIDRDRWLDAILAWGATQEPTREGVTVVIDRIHDAVLLHYLHRETLTDDISRAWTEARSWRQRVHDTMATRGWVRTWGGHRLVDAPGVAAVQLVSASARDVMTMIAVDVGELARREGVGVLREAAKGRLVIEAMREDAERLVRGAIDRLALRCRPVWRVEEAAR